MQARRGRALSGAPLPERGGLVTSGSDKFASRLVQGRTRNRRLNAQANPCLSRSTSREDELLIERLATPQL